MVRPAPPRYSCARPEAPVQQRAVCGGRCLLFRRAVVLVESRLRSLWRIRKLGTLWVWGGLRQGVERSGSRDPAQGLLSAAGVGEAGAHAHTAARRGAGAKYGEVFHEMYAEAGLRTFLKARAMYAGSLDATCDVGGGRGRAGLCDQFRSTASSHASCVLKRLRHGSVRLHPTRFGPTAFPTVSPLSGSVSQFRVPVPWFRSRLHA